MCLSEHVPTHVLKHVLGTVLHQQRRQGCGSGLQNNASGDKDEFKSKIETNRKSKEEMKAQRDLVGK